MWLCLCQPFSSFILCNEPFLYHRKTGIYFKVSYQQSKWVGGVYPFIIVLKMCATVEKINNHLPVTFKYI